jgi:hypothetical protein
MKSKTYGIYGLNEWHGKLKAGNIEVQVSFKGGTASPSGAQPAYFMTKDPITQFVIENSKEFKKGFIVLVMQQELPGVHPRMAIPKAQAAAPAQADVEEPVKQEGAKGEKVQVKVSSVEDAKDYLVEHFGLKSGNLRNRAACNAAGEQKGVEFIWE